MPLDVKIERQQNAMPMLRRRKSVFILSRLKVHFSINFYFNLIVITGTPIGGFKLSKVNQRLTLFPSYTASLASSVYDLRY